MEADYSTTSSTSGHGSADPMTQEFWTLGQALIWFGLRNQDCLRRFSKGLPEDEPHWDYWLSMKTGRIEPYYSAEKIAEIEESLRQELVSGRILSLGFRDGTGDRVPIPLEIYFRSKFLIFWSRQDPELRGVGVGSQRKGATKWRGVIVRRGEVMEAASRLFPVSQDRQIGDAAGSKEAVDVKLKSYWTTAELAAWIRTRQVRWVQAMDGSDGGGQLLDQMLAEEGIRALCSHQEALSEIKARIWVMGCSSHEHPHGIPRDHALYPNRYLRALNDRTELHVWYPNGDANHTFLRFPVTEVLDFYPDNHGEFEVESAMGAISTHDQTMQPDQACIKWLEEQMWDGKKFHPKRIKNECRDEAIDLFSISETAFRDVIWRTAIANTKGMAGVKDHPWQAKGAPRKEKEQAKTKK